MHGDYGCDVQLYTEIVMKRFALIVLGASIVFAQVLGVHSVYVLPMAGGLDQYLAERLIQDHVMQVVVNPKAADAVLTDRLGASFEQQLDKIHPLAKADKADGDKKDSDSHSSFRSGLAQGTIFLVDTKSRRVIWSDYEKPSRGGPEQEAERISRKLQAIGK
jgi:hypothetical protein